MGKILMVIYRDWDLSEETDFYLHVSGIIRINTIILEIRIGGDLVGWKLLELI